MRIVSVLSIVLLLCSCGGGSDGEDPTDTGSPLDSVKQEDTRPADDIEPEVSPPQEITAADAPGELPPQVIWQAPSQWSDPLYDYMVHCVQDMGLVPGNFDHGLKELAVFDGRMYLGYGDWTENTGPVDIRYFDPAEQLTIETTIDEESIDYYRIFDDRMYIPGVDPRQPAGADPLTGNVFIKPSGQDWQAHFELVHCLHVLDVVEWEGSIYACGSGNTDMDAYHAGDDMAVIWRSDDDGQSWDIELEWHDDDTGAVVRFQRFLPVEDELYLFGETINYDDGILTNIPRRYDGGNWTEVDLLSSWWIRHTDRFDQASGFVRGIDVNTGQFRITRLGAGGHTAPVGNFEARGEVVLDIFRAAEGDVLFLTRAGNDWPDETQAPWQYRVVHTDDLSTFTELLKFEHEQPLLSLALWQGALYFGAADGQIYRSEEE